MGKRGPKPKPTALRVFEGNPGRRPLVADDYQPEGVPIRPDGLDSAASWAWDFCVPELVLQGIAKRADTMALAGMVTWWSKYAACMAAMAQDHPDPDHPIDESLMKRAAIAWEKFSKAAACFGLNPSARAALKIDKGDAKSGLTDFLEKRKALT